MRRHVAILTSVAALLAFVLSCAGQAADNRTLVLNEIEINPAGGDHGNEWVEIVNLSDTAIDLVGWSISYTYRGPGVLPLVDGSRVLGPGERFVFVYPRIALRNAESNIIRLIDPAGWIVDETSPLLDKDDSDSTWQRFPDGGDPWFPDLWIFNAATRGRTND
jgi:hypothetical protein